MSHITKEYFEGHPTCPLFEELAAYLGVDLSAWEFTDGMEGEADDFKYMNVIYAPTHPAIEGEGYTLYGVFILEDDEWQIQQFGTNKDD